LTELLSKPSVLLTAWFLMLNGGNGRRATINLGIGHRLLVEDDMAIAGINFFTDYESKSSHKRLTSLRPAPNAFKNSLTELLSKPSVLLMAWFLMLVVTLLPSWSVLSELVWSSCYD
jgi:hypothetical protein